VDFANRLLGGAVLSRGRVQEEVRFSACPELLAACLWAESMEDNEAIVISGFQQFADTCGYAAGLEFVGEHASEAEVCKGSYAPTTYIHVMTFARVWIPVASLCHMQVQK